MECLEVRMIGLCKKCDLVVEISPMRFYNDGHVLYRNKDGFWVKLENNISHSRKSGLAWKWIVLAIALSAIIGLILMK